MSEGKAGTDSRGRRRGRFLVLDGVDGCGKSTQAVRLAAALAAARTKEGDEDAVAVPLHLREPGSTGLGEALRRLLLEPHVPLSPATELLLFAAARRAMLDELVEPALVCGRDVVCERFHPSTFAYQSVAGGLDPDQVMELLCTWVGSPAPDLVLLLALSDDGARERRSERGSSDRFEERGGDYLARVAEGYRRYAERDPRARWIDATGTPEEVGERILREVEAHVS